MSLYCLLKLAKKCIVWSHIILACVHCATFTKSMIILYSQPTYTYIKVMVHKQPDLHELRSIWAAGVVRCRRTQSGYDAAGGAFPWYCIPEVHASRVQLLAPSFGICWSSIERQTTLSALGWTTNDTFTLVARRAIRTTGFTVADATFFFKCRPVIRQRVHRSQRRLLR